MSDAGELEVELSAGKEARSVFSLDSIGRLRDSLTRAVYRLEWKAKSSNWANYTRYDVQAGDVSRKKQFVSKALSLLSAKMVWDLGANVGEYSILS
jgi:hypothetical protein